MYKLSALSLAVLVGSSAPTVSMAQEDVQNDKIFVMKSRVDSGSAPLLPAMVPSWSTASVTYTPWTNSSAAYDCSTWEAPVSLVNLFENFEQTRTCQQDQNRTRSEMLASKRLGSTRSGGVTVESRTITVEQTQPAQGTRDYITDAESEESWPSWSRDGGIYGCTNFSPDVAVGDDGGSFTKSRVCNEDQVRSRDVYEEYRSGKRVLLRTDTDSQTLQFNESLEVTYTPWAKSGGLFECSAWEAPVSSVNLFEEFEQTRSCKQAEGRTRTEVFSSERQDRTQADVVKTESRVVTVDQTQSAEGTRDYIVNAEAKESWSSWTRSGAIYDCGTFTPAVDTVNEGETFTQSRTCSEDQTRSRDVHKEYRSGNKVLLRTDTESRTIPYNDTRDAVGTYVDFFVVNTVVEYTSYVNTYYSCGGYSPSRYSVDYGQPMNQWGTCSGQQRRDAITYDIYNDGTRVEVSRVEEIDNYSNSSYRSTTGLRDYVVSERITGYGSWDWVYGSCRASDEPGFERPQERRVNTLDTYASGKTRSGFDYEWRWITCN